MSAFSTRAEFHAWLENEGLTHVGRLNLEVVAPYLDQSFWPSLRTVGARRRLSDLASRDGVASSLDWLKPSPLREALLNAVKSFIEAERTATEKARSQLAARQRRPADARAAAVYSRLMQLRTKLPPNVAPRLTELLAPDALVFDATLPGFTWKDAQPTEMPLRNGGGFSRPVVKLSLRDGALASTCTCGAMACVHQLAAIDTALLQLESLDDEALDELARPAWQRTLESLKTAVTSTATKPASAITFRITVPGDDGVEVSAWVDDELAKPEFLLARAGADAPLVTLIPARGEFAPRALLEGLVDSNRVFLARDPTLAVRIERVTVGLVADDRGGAVTVNAGIEGATFPPYLQERLRTVRADDTLYLWDEGARRLTLLDVRPEIRAALEVLSKDAGHFPPEAHAQLLETLAALAQQVPVAMPRSVLGESVPVQCLPVLRLEARPRGSVQLELRVKPLPDAPAQRPGEGPRDVHLRRGIKPVHAVRDLGAELDVMHALARELPLGTAQPDPHRPFLYEFEHGSDVFELLEEAGRRAEPPILEWVGKPLRNLGPTGPRALRVEVRNGIDWFGALGELSVFGERVELGRLLEAARRDASYVEVAPQTYIELSETLRDHLKRVAAHTRRVKDDVLIGPSAIDALRELKRAGATVDGDTKWKKLVTNAEGARDLVPELPAGLDAKLRPYQLEGFQWLTRLAYWGAGGVLADDMGLGKTLQALAVLLDRAADGPALVVVPTSVLFNWRDEAKRFAPKLRVHLYPELSRDADALKHLGKNDVLVVSYGLLVRDAKKLAREGFATVVFDEAQQLKNPGTQRYRAAKSLKADFKFALSGTPIENHLGELWSLFSLVFPPLLGTWDEFRERYALPIEKRIAPAAAPELAQVLQPFLLRRTKSEVASELPARTDVRVPIVLSAAEWELYEDTRLAALSDLESPGNVLREQERRVQVLAMLTRLRLAASHPRLLDDSSPHASSKLARLMELVEELTAEGQRMLIFSQFTSHLALVKAALDARGISSLGLDGSTTAADRKKRVKEFQEGSEPVFLISLKAGGVGLNLTAATNVIQLDPWWNPAVEDQASDRAHRLGQNHPVTVYRLVAMNTVEELMLGLHARKRALIAEVLEGKSAAGKLSSDELLALLRAREPAQ